MPTPDPEFMRVVGIVLLTGFAIQQFLQMIDPLVAGIISWLRSKRSTGDLPGSLPEADFKKALMSLIAFTSGIIVVLLTKIRTLYYIDPDQFGDSLFGDLLVTALVISAGTEGVNTLLKYFGYVKDSRKIEVHRRTEMHLAEMQGPDLQDFSSRTEVVVQRETNARDMTVQLDSSVLRFTGNEARVTTSPGVHRLSWTVEGRGSRYHIKVTSPSYVECEDSIDSTPDEIVVGACEFRIV